MNRPTSRWSSQTKRRFPYGWGYIAGALLIFCGFSTPIFRLADPFLPPPDIGDFWMYGAWLIVAPLAGIGMLFRKAFGWYLYFAIIALPAIFFLLSAILFISNVGIIGEGAMAGGDVFGELLPSILLLTFLIHQMLYWGNRSTRQNASESLTT